jgi:copper chaperone CopZ
MKLNIKNMVCSRCIRIVKAQLETLGIHYFAVEIGSVTIDKKLTRGMYSKLSDAQRSQAF